MFEVLENLGLHITSKYGMSVNTNVFFVNASCCSRVSPTQGIYQYLFSGFKVFNTVAQTS